jgi:hypothetical protein
MRGSWISQPVLCIISAVDYFCNDDAVAPQPLFSQLKLHTYVFKDTLQKKYLI